MDSLSADSYAGLLRSESQFGIVFGWEWRDPGSNPYFVPESPKNFRGSLSQHSGLLGGWEGILSFLSSARFSIPLPESRCWSSLFKQLFGSGLAACQGESDGHVGLQSFHLLSPVPLSQKLAK